MKRGNGLGAVDQEGNAAPTFSARISQPDLRSIGAVVKPLQLKSISELKTIV
jgi:hypothetical protein